MPQGELAARLTGDTRNAEAVMSNNSVSTHRAVIEVVGNVAMVDADYPSGHHYRFAGGAGLHFAQAASQAGATVILTSVLGRDMHWVLPRLRGYGILTDRVLLAEGISASFSLHYGENGAVSGIESRHGSAEQLTEHALAQTTLGHRHVCCRTPLDARRVLAATSPDASFSLDFFVSSASVQLAEAAPYLTRASVMFVNASELLQLQEVAALVDLQCLVATAGEGECRVYRHGIATATATPPAVQPVDVTGAGDTLAGTFLALILQGLSDIDALRVAVQAATASTLRLGGIELSR